MILKHKAYAFSEMFRNRGSRVRLNLENNGKETIVMQHDPLLKPPSKPFLEYLAEEVGLKVYDINVCYKTNLIDITVQELD